MKIILKAILVLSLIFISYKASSKPLFIGDSLTYRVAVSYSQLNLVDARFLIGSGLVNNKKFDWISYVDNLNIKKYDTVYVFLGTNDLINKAEINAYRDKVATLILKIKYQNENIVWVLPPTLKDERKNILLNNTRYAIKNVLNEMNIRYVDMRSVLGDVYLDEIEGKKVRTPDGVHLTEYGSELVATKLFKK
ncbi:GDSL-type esterase/lipase family protein [Proteus mirabilis]|nr:hypothetical protein [Proteus mirabilis]ELB1171897.1 hypothetical protein [Proteus mirabilis]